MNIQELVRAQRAYFLSGATRSYAFRMEQLKKLQQALRSNEALLEQAMYQDFRKAPWRSTCAKQAWYWRKCVFI